MTAPGGSAVRLVTRGDQLWFHAPFLAIVPGLVHGVTHAESGNFSLSVGDDPAAVAERRARLLGAAGLGEAAVLAPRLFHTSAIGTVADGRLPEGQYDGLVTAVPGVALAVTVADCVPVFLVDAATGAYGLAHAGWRGIAGGIVREAVGALRAAAGSRPADILVGAGPAIRGPQYEVGPEVAGLFPETFAVPTGRPERGRFLLDLPSCALADAAAAGVPRENLVDFSLCTASHAGTLFSYRRGDEARHWAFIGRP